MLATSQSTVRRQHLMWHFGGLSLGRLARAVLRDAMENEIFERASGLAFDFVFALFPLLFILLAVFSLFASHSVQLRTSLLAYFADLLPAMAFGLLKGTAEELAESKSAEKLTIGILLGLWFSSGGVASIISALNAVFRVRESRSWFRVRAIALGLAVVISILTLSALGLVMVGSEIVDWTAREFQITSVMILAWKAAQLPTALLFVIVSDALIYRFGPNRMEKQWRWITPGSLFAATTWMIVSLGFRVYLRYVNNYAVVFGSLGAAAILLVWLYVSGLAFLIGGEINATIERASAQNMEDTGETTSS